jgi:hypothetical protein
MDDASLSRAFLNVVAELKSLQYGLTAADDTTALAHALGQLCAVIDATRVPQAVTDMVARHHHVLCQLQGALSRYRELRSHQDRLFGRLRRIAGWRAAAPATRTFEAFIKGITYFASEHDDHARPAYHRLYSCGPSNQAYREGNLICSEGLSAAELRRRRPLIERCYIERLVYDQIYKHEALRSDGVPADMSSYANAGEGDSGEGGATQNEGHLFNLERTLQDFETCFPQTKLTVHVSYHDGMPHRLVVRRTTPANGTVKLVYEKDFFHASRSYSEVATCTKFMPDGSVWLKTSDFDTQGTFTLRRPAAAS